MPPPIGVGRIAAECGNALARAQHGHYGRVGLVSDGVGCRFFGSLWLKYPRVGSGIDRRLHILRSVNSDINSVVGCGEIADPTPGADEALIEVRAAGTNPVEISMREGHF
jgi:hypothetical protein